MTLRSVLKLSKEEELNTNAAPKVNDASIVIKKKKPTRVQPPKDFPEWIEAGVNVVVQSEDEEKPFIGAILQVNSKKRKVLVSWYYRPEDTSSGRLYFHGSYELFKSDHKDWISVDTIINACHVYQLDEYEKNMNRKGKKDDEMLTYFTRFDYSAITSKFKETPVRLFCICNQPQNPDRLMVQCDRCSDWFHPSCLGAKDVELKKLDTFICPLCIRRSE